VKVVETVLRVLTLVTAGLAALIFPIMLFAIQGFGGFSFELVTVLLTLYLLHPASIVLIFLASFRKIPAGRPTTIARGVIALNALLLLATAALIAAGAIKGDTEIPLLFAAPSILFLLNSRLGART